MATVRTERPNDTAWQRFLGTGPLALLPVRDGYSNVVWSTSIAEAARLEALSPQQFALNVNQVDTTFPRGSLLSFVCELLMRSHTKDVCAEKVGGPFSLKTICCASHYVLTASRMCPDEVHCHKGGLIWTQALQGGSMPARNPMLPTASSEDFAPPPTVFAAEGAKPQQSFPLALLGSGRCGSCMPTMHRQPSSHAGCIHQLSRVVVSKVAHVALALGPCGAS